MLDNMKKGDKIDSEGTMEELKNACESSLPKIKNMLKEEQDVEKVELLNEAKSIIKGVTLKYQDIKNGNYSTDYDISGKFKSETSNQFISQPISLIDLDDEVSDTTNQHSTMDELTDVFGPKLSVTSPTLIDPFDLLSQSINTNTLPAASPTPSKSSVSSSPIAISSPRNESIIKSSEFFCTYIFLVDMVTNGSFFYFKKKLIWLIRMDWLFDWMYMVPIQVINLKLTILINLLHPWII